MVDKVQNDTPSTLRAVCIAATSVNSFDLNNPFDTEDNGGPVVKIGITGTCEVLALGFKSRPVH